MIGLLILVAGSLMFMNVRSKFLRFSVSMALFVGLGTAYHLGWEKIEPRLINIFSDNMSSRTQIYETTLKMIDDYGKFGSGPGSFEAITQFELGGILSRWESWAHNDYLEFYLTFGILGAGILIALIATLALQYLATLIMESSTRSYKWFGLLSIAGVATHAVMDFPLQVYSIVALITLIIAATSTFKTTPRARPTTN